jgi:SAM-dependent methyltransferase
MNEDVAKQLIELNHQFYQTFARAFAATRQRIQPGVRALLPRLPQGNWLDLGCGNGALAQVWQHSRSDPYLGLDFSAGLLMEARRLNNTASSQIQFIQADLSDPTWPASLPHATFDGVLCFAVLHHLPGQARRLALLQQVANLLPAGSWFVHSVWQFHLSPRLQARVLPWTTIGLNAEQVEEGDYLLDWRHSLPEQAETIGLRYVHRFCAEELLELAHAAGFQICETFESDGEGGRLGLYQIWQRRA